MAQGQHDHAAGMEHAVLLLDMGLHRINTLFDDCNPVITSRYALRVAGCGLLQENRRISNVEVFLVLTPWRDSCVGMNTVHGHVHDIALRSSHNTLLIIFSCFLSFVFSC